MIFLIIAYWIFSTIFVGLCGVSEKDSFKYGIVVGCISVFWGWLILPIACVYYVYKILKNRFL